jgi:hypothetical protein
MDFGVGRVTVGLSGRGLLSHYGRGCVDTPPTADRFVEADHFGLDLGRPLDASGLAFQDRGLGGRRACGHRADGHARRPRWRSPNQRTLLKWPVVSLQSEQRQTSNFRTRRKFSRVSLIARDDG